MKRGEELGIVCREERKWDGVDQKLHFVWTGFEEIPRGVAYRKDLVQPRGKGSEVRSLSEGGGVKVGTEQ